MSERNLVLVVAPGTLTERERVLIGMFGARIREQANVGADQMFLVDANTVVQEDLRTGAITYPYKP